MAPACDTAADPPAPGGAPVGAPAAPRAPAPETLRLYQADWRGFATWCDDAGLTSLPAAPATVAAFLGAAAEKLSAGALSRRAAAIGGKHRERGLVSPAADPAVTAILREARRHAVPRRDPPHRPAQLVRMAGACPGDLSGVRDRALLLLFSAGLDRAALVGLDVEHVRFTAAAIELSLSGPGVDGEAERRLTVAHGTNPRLCPAQALRDWLDTSETRFGPVFRKIDRWGNVEHSRLGTDAIRRVMARRTPRRARRGPRARGADA